MAKLIVKFNNEVVDHLDLKQGDMKIGRRPGCDVFLDNLAVSGEHANIFTVGEDSFIQDLGSTNGTFINNKKITKHHLRNGDAVAIGKHTLIYMTDTQAATPQDFAKTVIISSAAVRDTAAAKPSPAPAPKSELRGELVILSGANSGKRIELTKSITNLGKTGVRAGCITRANDGFMIAPSEEGGEIPKLNGKAVATEGTILKNGDVIEVVGTRLQFMAK